MEIPTYGSVPLLSSATPAAGAAFALQEPATESERVALDQWNIEVSEGQKFVIARGGEAADYDAAFTGGILMAQRGLDMMSMRGVNHLVVRGSDDDHLVWWTDADGLVIRIVSIAPLSFNVPPAELSLRDRSGQLVPTPELAPAPWHESFRYFRLSQTTEDLFDAFRNAYLALESALSSIAPQQTGADGRVTEREGQWFKRALTAAQTRTPLGPFVPAGVSSPVQFLWENLYRDTRSAMSHAKSGRNVLLPQNQSDREAVTASLHRLVALYIRLAEKHLGYRRAGGGIFAAFFRMMTSPTLDSMTTFASDDESPMNTNDTKPNPAGGILRAMSPGPPATAHSSFVVTRLWSARCEELSDLRFVRRIVGVDGDTPSMAAVLDARLTLGQAKRFEVVLGVRGSNTRQPRVRYPF